MVTALDRVSDVDARHETVQRRALVELVVLAGIGLLFLVALLARTAIGIRVGGRLGDWSEHASGGGLPAPLFMSSCS